MSSTHDPQGARGYRAESDDFYETPLWCVDRLLEAYTPPSGRWLEPCAGRGAIIYAVNRHLPGHAHWTALDKNPSAEPILKAYSGANVVLPPGDFLTYPFESNRFTEPPFDVSITNPPYKRAAEILARSLYVSQVTILLLRLGFLATQDRNPFMSTAAPDVYVLPDRPPYRGGSTDSTDYGWFVWDRDLMPRKQGCIQVLNTTPVSVRKART